MWRFCVSLGTSYKESIWCTNDPDTHICKRWSFIWRCFFSVSILNPHIHNMGPRRPKHYIFGDHLYSKEPESSGSIYSCISMLENIWYHHFTWSGSNSQEIVSKSVKVVAKNILLGFLGTQPQAVFGMWCLFLKKQTNFLNQTVTLKCFSC